MDALPTTLTATSQAQITASTRHLLWEAERGRWERTATQSLHLSIRQADTAPRLLRRRFFPNVFALPCPVIRTPAPFPSRPSHACR
jgi:hypothetical protein